MRQRLEPLERALPVRLPGSEGPSGTQAGEQPLQAGTPANAEDAVARIDAARARLRASIEPPEDPAA